MEIKLHLFKLSKKAVEILSAAFFIGNFWTMYYYCLITNYCGVKFMKYLLAVFAVFLCLMFVACDGTDDKKSEEEEIDHEELQLITVKNIQSLGMSIEAYEMDNYRLGSPKCANIDELIELFLSLDYQSDADVILDGWGNKFAYEADMAIGVKNFTLTSYGSDAKSGPTTAKAGVVTKFEEDIIFSDGTFVQSPEIQ